MRILTLALVVALGCACSASADGPAPFSADGSADAPACPRGHVSTPRGCLPALDTACGWSARPCPRGHLCGITGRDDAGVAVAVCFEE